MSKRADYTLKWMVVGALALAVTAAAINNTLNPGGLKFADAGKSHVETARIVSSSESSGHNEP
jgi:hypothetical protein